MEMHWPDLRQGRTCSSCLQTASNCQLLQCLPQLSRAASLKGQPSWGCPHQMTNHGGVYRPCHFGPPRSGPYVLQSSVRGQPKLCQDCNAVQWLAVPDPASFPFHVLSQSSYMSNSVSVSGKPACKRQHIKMISARKMSSPSSFLNVTTNGSTYRGFGALKNGSL